MCVHIGDQDFLEPTALPRTPPQAQNLVSATRFGPSDVVAAIPTLFPSPDAPGCPHTVSAQRNDWGYGHAGPTVRD